MGNELSHPTIEKVDSEEYITSSGLSIGASGLQGHRESMEDTHIIMDFPSRSDHSLVAIFDGHGGAGIANYAKEHFIRVCEERPEWKNYIAKGNDLEEHIEDLRQVLIQTFYVIDEEMRSTIPASFMRSGATACVAILTSRHIVCANAGDARCVIGTSKAALALSEDHKPELPLEKARVEAAGGCINFGRIDGNLNVSRGLGDGSYKQNTEKEQFAQKVSPHPDIRIYERNNDKDDVLIVACDGLWDVIESEQAVEKIRDLYNVGEKSSLLLAEELVHGALFHGKSQDNISAVVCILPAAEFGPEEEGGVISIREYRKFLRQDEYGVPEDLYDKIVGMTSPEPHPMSVFYNDKEDY